MRRHGHHHRKRVMLRVNPENGQHTLHLKQREIATLRVIAAHQPIQSVADAMREIIGDCGDERCEACSLDGDDAHDARERLYG